MSVCLSVCLHASVLLRFLLVSLVKGSLVYCQVPLIEEFARLGDGSMLRAGAENNLTIVTVLTIIPGRQHMMTETALSLPQLIQSIRSKHVTFRRVDL